MLCFKCERNFRFHIVFTGFVFWFSGFFGLDRGEYAILALTCGLVIFADAFNTAVENAVDFTGEKYSDLAKNAKDAAAGGVLLAAVTAVAVGLFLFGKKSGFVAMYDYYADNPLMFALLLAAIAAGVVIVFAIPLKPGK